VHTQTTNTYPQCTRLHEATGPLESTRVSHHHPHLAYIPKKTRFFYIISQHNIHLHLAQSVLELPWLSPFGCSTGLGAVRSTPARLWRSHLWRNSIWIASGSGFKLLIRLSSFNPLSSPPPLLPALLCSTHLSS